MVVGLPGEGWVGGEVGVAVDAIVGELDGKGAVGIEVEVGGFGIWTVGVVEVELDAFVVGVVG